MGGDGNPVNLQFLYTDYKNVLSPYRAKLSKSLKGLKKLFEQIVRTNTCLRLSTPNKHAQTILNLFTSEGEDNEYTS